MKDSIEDLDVHRLDGEFYAEIKKYLEKQGVRWEEERGREKELLSVRLSFPKGTTAHVIPSPGRWPEAEQTERRQISFEAGGILYWSIRKNTGENGISVPYVYLG